MEARSYVENIANRTTMRGVITALTGSMLALVLIGALGLAFLSGFHPAGMIAAAVLLVLSVVLARDLTIMLRLRRTEPLDLSFDPAPTRGLVSPGTIFGAAGALLLFGVVLAVVTRIGSPDAPLTWPLSLGVLGLLLGLAGVPTLGVRKRKWRVLADVLREHPAQIAYLQDARRRFPPDAPFPFQAPSDVVTIP